MADENSGRVDLLGDPWTEARDPRGRKRHKRTVEVAEKVAVLRAAGLTVEQIAARVMLSEPTLRLYYFRELESGVALAKAMVIEAMYDKARKGVVGAARFMREEFLRGEIAVPVGRRQRAVKAAEPDADAEEAPVVSGAASEKLGKKAAANRDAQTAHEGTSWGDVLH